MRIGHRVVEQFRRIHKIPYISSATLSLTERKRDVIKGDSFFFVCYFYIEEHGNSNSLGKNVFLSSRAHFNV